MHLIKRAPSWIQTRKRLGERRKCVLGSRNLAERRSFPSQYGGEFTIASFKENACTAGYGHPCFWNLYSTILVDVVRVKSSVGIASSLHPACVPVRVTINKLKFVPKRVVSGVSVFRNGGGLGTDKSDVSLMLFDSVLHRSSSLADVNLTAFPGNPLNHAILFSLLDSVLRTRYDLIVVSDLRTAGMPCCRKRKGFSDRLCHKVKPQ